MVLPISVCELASKPLLFVPFVCFVDSSSASLRLSVVDRGGQLPAGRQLVRFAGEAVGDVAGFTEPGHSNGSSPCSSAVSSRRAASVWAVSESSCSLRVLGNDAEIYIQPRAGYDARE